MTDKKPLKISCSSLQVLDECHRKWYLRYVAKIYPKTSNEAGMFGNFIHDVAENWNGQTLDEFKTHAKEILNKHNIAASYKHKVAPALKNLYCYYKSKFNKGVTEKEKKIDIPIEDGVLLTGKIDVLHTYNNKVMVIDYKTNKADKDHTFQLAFYYHMLKLMDILKEDTLECEIVYLCREDNGFTLQVSPYTITADDVHFIVSKIQTSIDMLNHLGTIKEKWRKNEGPLCNYCDYYKEGHCDGRVTKTF